VNRFWTSKGIVPILLLPVTALFWLLSSLRFKLYRAGILKVRKFNIPVVVVGNISVGGTGKSPMVAGLVNTLREHGYKPGIVSRGYGAERNHAPRLVDLSTAVSESGDEPVMLAAITGVPVCICSERHKAVYWLENNTDVDIVVSDDGLQHYAMHRDLEIVVVDGDRLFGNGWLLPSGPLRETPGRLEKADLVAVQLSSDLSGANRARRENNIKKRLPAQVCTGFFSLSLASLTNLATGVDTALAEFSNRCVHAVAGLGNPARFFDSLRSAGINVKEHPFPDHHPYVASDLQFGDDQPVLVTSKDAVKIKALQLNHDSIYEFAVKARLDSELEQGFVKLMTKFPRETKADMSL